MNANACGSKLSRHVLGMKFMRKTKVQVDKEKTENTFRKHFSRDGSKSATSVDSSGHSAAEESTTGGGSGVYSQDGHQHQRVIIELCPSYSQIEGHIFGRQSFGGFNPVVEHNVKNGIWRPFHLDPYSATGEDIEDGEISEDDGEKDVSDEEMAKTYGSLVGTLGKRFQKKNNVKNERKKKFKRGKKRPAKDDKNDDDVEMIDIAEDNDEEVAVVEGGGGDKSKGKRKKGWKNFFKGGNKGSYNVNKGSNRKNKRKVTEDSESTGQQQQQNPRKKMKFMKPSDD